MLRLAHYLPQIRLEQGGVVRAVLDLCKILAGRGHQVTLITTDRRDVPPDWNAPQQPQVVTLPTPGGLLELLPKRAKLDLLRVLRDLDALHLHAPWIASNVQVASLARRIGLPYILSPHGMLDDWSMAQKSLKKRLYLSLVGNRLIRGAARIHCTAQGELDQAGKWFDRSRGIVLPLLVDLADFQSLPNVQHAETPHLLYLSRIHPKKGIWPLLDAVAILHRQKIDLQLTLAGPAEDSLLAALKQKAKDLHIEQLIRFPGMVTGADKVRLYQSADLFVLPTSQENFGLVLLEAMACGAPVVTTKGVDIWPELEQAGAVIESTDPSALAAAVARLLADRDALRQRGLRGRAWVLEHFAPDRIAAGYEAMYQQAARSVA